jgi:inorganic pyrophosphatase
MNLANCPNHFDPKKRECKVIIETPKGGRNKFRYEPDFEMFGLSGLLGEGLAFPFDFGFIPSTRGADGDPLDVMVLLDAPAHVGCLLDVRLIGVIEAVQKERGKQPVDNDRLLGVAVHSHSHENVGSIEEVNQSLLDQVEQFFVAYNISKGRKFVVKGRHGPKRAVKLLQQGIRVFHSQEK